MGFSKDVIVDAFVRENGRCQICGEKLVFKNKGMEGRTGAWDVVHKVSVSRGGSNSLRNCIVVCEECFMKLQRPQNVEKPRNRNSFDELILDRSNFSGGSSFDDLILDRSKFSGGNTFDDLIFDRRR